MRFAGLLLLSMAAAAISPLLALECNVPVAHAAFPAWPHEFRGRPLVEMRLNADERRFLADFPGAVARFSDGEHDIIMRWVGQPTRRLHQAEDCYRGWGYEVSQSRLHKDADGTPWRCFTARNGKGERAICEQMRDLEGTHFTDVSSWYWAATLHKTTGPWLVTTVAQ
ncbi:MAG: hypothetical protein ABI769_01275 [Pseudomonadota bacterium]